VVSVAPLLGEAIRCIHEDRSVSKLLAEIEADGDE
jgi:phosphoribosylpyrophosphate synthetase